ncbi:MAG TPA: DNA polymerase III subunit gamma/tau [Candidatus Acidoferrum sp.]|nr:DNA polymerase III subunit gamma/tau [Candidatus Acidoferrum sp.]
MPALYRTYRSKSLAEVVGQEHITQTLANAIASGRISHAYLFTGPRGVGKTSVARILAHEINGLPYSETGHLDIIEIDAASNRRIDDVRDLRDKVHIAPVSAKYKVYIIDEVHMLTGEAFNALLKTLEEPPAHVVFILATTEVHKLPATIISRAQRYSFRAAPADKVVMHLKYIADQEHISIDDAALQLIAEHGEGSFRDSISLLDQMANLTGGNITAAAVEQTLGLAPRGAMAQLVAALMAKNRSQVVSQLTQLATQGATSASLLPQLLRALQAAGLYDLLDELLEVPRAYNPEIKLLTTLVKHTIAETNSSPMAPTSTEPEAAQAAKAEEPIIEETVLESSEAEISEPEGDTSPVSEPAQKPSAAGTWNADVWQNALQAVGKASQPLQSVLKHAELSFDPDTTTLTLAFQYKLHSNRVEEMKAKALLANALAEAYGSPVQIAVVLNADRPAPAAPALDPLAQSVADLMGGGEAVNI